MLTDSALYVAHVHTSTLTHCQGALFKAGLEVQCVLLYVHAYIMPAIQMTPADRVGAVLMCLGGPAAWFSSHVERQTENSNSFVFTAQVSVCLVLFLLSEISVLICSTHGYHTILCMYVLVCTHGGPLKYLRETVFFFFFGYLKVTSIIYRERRNDMHQSFMHGFYSLYGQCLKHMDY